MAVDQWSEPIGQGWLQVGELALAFVLSSLIGLEREFRQKSAGLRTHTLVGVGAALFMLSPSTASPTSSVAGSARTSRSTRPGWPRRSSPASASSVGG